MPTILLIAPEYPPSYPVGYARTAAFEKYLPEFGFQTAVLTTRSYGTLPTDRAHHVYRAWDAGMLYLPLTRRFLPSPRPRAPGIPTAGSEVSPFRSTLRIMLSATQKLATNVLVPDFQVTWLPAALWGGRHALRDERADMIYSSSPPETAHLVAGLLSHFMRTPWVADFRDGWLFESLKPPLRQNGWRRWLEQRLERWTVTQASAVVTVSQPITDYFCKTYADMSHKFHTIPNGYDPDNWQGIQPKPRDPTRFRLVYTGALAHSRPSLDPQPFLCALAAWPLSMRDCLEVVLVGTLGEAEQRLVTELSLDGTVRILGQKSKAESLAYQLSADVLLLIAGKDRSVATSKLYEYLYAGRPILALAAPDSAAAQIVTQTQAGEVVDPTDSVAITVALTRLFDRWRENKLTGQTRAIEAYHRRHLTRQLANVFSAVLSERGR